MNFLYDYYSVSKCLLAADRSMRLCTQTPGGEKHKQALLPSYNDLVAKNKAFEDAVKNKYAGKDKVRLCDSFLDTTIIKLHHACEDYDNAHPGSFTRTTLFSDGNYGPLINMNMYKEPEKVLEIAQKVETFGATHELFPMAATLKSVEENSEEAITDEAAAIKAEGLAKANTEIAKLKLIRTYNGNYYKAADEGGKEFAERLFPDLGGSDSKEEPEVEPKENQ